jgi:phage terminase large subunit GpA-like protein
VIKPSRAAIAVVVGALVAIIEPPQPITPSVWAADNLVVPDGPRAGELWDAALTPYVPEILDSLAPDQPYTEISVRKSAQTGLTTLMIAWLTSTIVAAPCRMMIVLPTIDALQEFNREKLSPAIEATDALRERVHPQTSRSAGGSTQFSKRFPGGSLVLANANSANDLSSKTIKYIGCDEVDRWPDDLDGQGDPMSLVDARYMSFRATRDYKKFVISTPTIEGASRIDDAFLAGDQRLWHIRCPHCQTEIPLKFQQLRFERTKPYGAYYLPQCCGFADGISAGDKNRLVRAGQFIATEPGPGRSPSYHVDTLISLLVPWDDIAEAWWNAQGDEKKLKAFYNLWLGLPYQVRGDAPEWERLMERRADYAPRTIPAGGLVLTGFADVQGDGIYFEAVAWGRDLVSWTVDYGFLPGSTDDANSGAFLELRKVIDRTYPDAYGRRLEFDAFGVDAGYNQHVVATFTRGLSTVYACKGIPGWFQPAIGSATPVDINYKGKRTKRGAMLWPVGNYSLKGTFYARLRKEGRQAGEEVDPPGYCHFGQYMSEDYFRQITAESCVTVKKNGRSHREWKEHGPNHYLDCRIGNMAMAELPHLGLSRMTDDDWKALATVRGVPDGELDGLFAPRAMVTASADDEKPAGAADAGAVDLPVNSRPRNNPLAAAARLAALNRQA